MNASIKLVENKTKMITQAFLDTDKFFEILVMQITTNKVFIQYETGLTPKELLRRYLEKRGLKNLWKILTSQRF